MKKAIILGSVFSVLALMLASCASEPEATTTTTRQTTVTTAAPQPVGQTTTTTTHRMGGGVGFLVEVRLGANSGTPAERVDRGNSPCCCC